MADQLDTTSNLSQNAEEATAFITAQLPEQVLRPSIAVICGSGLGGIVNTLQPEPRCQIDYARIPHFPSITVDGHAGALVIGMLDGTTKPVVLMLGRAHHYEGHSFQNLTFPVRVLRQLGVEKLIVTNAAGALNPSYAVGDLVVLMDHISLTSLAGNNPLRGPNADDFGPRFVALSDAYNLRLRRQIHNLWKQLGKSQGSSRRLHEGVYAFVGGPSYETRAECRMLHLLGADVVGMSTVPEIIVARHCNMDVLGLSLVTNKAVLDSGPRGDDVNIQAFGGANLGDLSAMGKANHSEVLEAGREASLDVQHLICRMVTELLETPL